MVAEHRYAPPQSRTASAGAALLINGALIAGLIFAAPNVISKGPEGGIKIIDIFDPPVPPPVEPPKPQPNVEKRATTAPLPNAPDSIIKTKSDNPVETTPTIFPPLPPLPPKAEPGPLVIAEPPAPLPPLLGANVDPRFAADFQPPYPSQELRAQRDGRVSLRILIGIDGRVKAVEQVSATSTAFFEAAKRQALSKWRFKPATRGGIPEESWKVMTVRFEIANL